MKQKNNLKQIREIYGATQEEIAQILNVNRATISQWENGVSIAANSYLEKLSIFYGIGPESFYEIDELDDNRKNMLLSSAKRATEVKSRTSNERDKNIEISSLFERTSFIDARKIFMFSMKMLLATADQAKLNDLKIAYEINQKMARRLEAIIKIREEEEKAKEENNEETLYDLLDSFLEDAEES